MSLNTTKNYSKRVPTTANDIIQKILIIIVFSLPLLIKSSNESKCKDLRVLSLNTWGMIELLGSEFREERMNAIAKVISKGEFDVYLLQELWMKKDHHIIESQLPKGYSMTGFRQLSGHVWGGASECDGVLFPTGCSGLAIISRYPIKEVQFDKFSVHGDGSKSLVDGEVLVRKGAGRISIKPLPKVTVDIFSTHTVADPDPSHGYNNSYYRLKQVHQLMDKWISNSTADVVILGGDFNAAPEDDKNSVYQIVKRHMKNSAEEMYSKNNEWIEDTFATYGNPSNTFTGGKYHPKTYDFIFWRVNNPEGLNVHISFFKLPLYKARISKQMILREMKRQRDLRKDRLIYCPELPHYYDYESAVNRMKLVLRSNDNSTEISISDHEDIISTLSICLF